MPSHELQKKCRSKLGFYFYLLHVLVSGNSVNRFVCNKDIFRFVCAAHSFSPILLLTLKIFFFSMKMWSHINN